MNTREDFDAMERWLLTAADRLAPEQGADWPAVGEMLHDTTDADPWWRGVWVQSAEQEDRIGAAAIDMLEGGEPPEYLSLPDRGRLALRFLLASRWARAMGSRPRSRPSGALPRLFCDVDTRRLAEMLVTEWWPFLAEVFDESLIWAPRAERLAPPWMMNLQPPDQRPPREIPRDD